VRATLRALVPASCSILVRQAINRVCFALLIVSPRGLLYPLEKSERTVTCVMGFHMFQRGSPYSAQSEGTLRRSN
jgi:hypothetical protein